jgi:hypothetical protein
VAKAFVGSNPTPRTIDFLLFSPFLLIWTGILKMTGMVGENVVILFFVVLFYYFHDVTSSFCLEYLLLMVVC